MSVIISDFLNIAYRHTQSARQHKDATDLIYQESIGALTSSDRKGPNSQYVSQNKLIVETPLLIRRLTPLECERLQGFPDGWTDLPGASDSARYKALGNSVANAIVVEKYDSVTGEALPGCTF